MILLDTNTKLEIVLGGTPTTQLDWLAVYIDTTDDTPKHNDGTTNSTTDVDLVTAPASDKRLVRYLNIHNNDNATQSVTVKIDDGVNERVLVSKSLDTGDTLIYDSQSGWYIAFATSGGGDTDTKKVKVSSNDTTENWLEDKLSNNGNVAFTTENDGGNETIKGDVTSVTDTNEPTGFINRTDSVISFVDATRTFTIQPVVTEYDYYINGTKYNKTGTDNVVIADTEGTHYIYFNGTTLTETTTFTTALLTDNAYVVAIYWDATNKEHIYFGDERHGIVMDGATHTHFHLGWGTRYDNGLAITNVVDTSGDNDAHAQIAVTDGVIRDEDIKVTITDDSPQDISTIGKIPVYYKEGAGSDWRVKRNTYSTWQASTAYSQGDRVLAVTGNASTRGLIFEIYLGGDAGTSGGSEPAWQEEVGTVSADGGDPIGATTTDNTATWTCVGSVNTPIISFRGTQDSSGTWLCAWNEFTGGAWQQTVSTDNDFVLIHIWATNDIENPIIAVQGEANYINTPDAQDGALVEISDLYIGGLPFQEFVPVGTIIAQTGTGRDNIGKIEFQNVTGPDGSDGNYIDWTKQTFTPGGSPSNHENLSGLLGGGAGDHQHLTTAELTVVQNTSNTNTGDEVDATTTTKGIVELATDGESGANVVVQGNDSRMSNARTPTAHKTTHQSGGSDAIKLDDLCFTR